MQITQRMATQQVIGFPPLLAGKNEEARILVLGSAPSVKSLEMQQYYGHPRNAFWWIMGQLFNFDHQVSYPKRQKLLSQNGVILWDVLESCERTGSLDSAIQTESELANDIPMLLKHYQSISQIACNGGAAMRLLKKHHSQLFDGAYEVMQMPSTSPAYAIITKEQKLEKWSQLR